MSTDVKNAADLTRGLVREARAAARNAMDDHPCLPNGGAPAKRELALAITKLDEAEMWLDRWEQTATPPVDEGEAHG